MLVIPVDAGMTAYQYGSEKMETTETEVATGCMIRAADLRVSDTCSISDFGADPQAGPVVNTRAVNAALKHVEQVGGGTVTVPAGRYEVYTVQLRSRVNIYMCEGAVLAAARTDIRHGICDVQGERFTQEGQGGNYLEPEINPYVGIQDHAHSYLRNCLIWGDRIHDAMISGPGLLDGSWIDSEGNRHEALSYSDPRNPDSRFKPGYREEWFGNKGIALFRSTRVVLSGFKFLAGGHFAIIATDTSDLLCDSLLIDTNRDGIDLDSVTDVTVRRCQVNSPHDDGIVVKASMGAQRFAPTSNVLIEDCEVSGYDVGSVLAGSPSVDRVACHPGINPIGRVKLGTEATCGYERVTIRRVSFRHCFGLAVEACDGSDVRHVLIEDIDMKDVTCPLFIRTGDRARYPVTGLDGNDAVAVDGDVRLDQPEWVLPNTKGLDLYPIRRFVPSYNTNEVRLADGNLVELVDEQNPTRVNPSNWMRGPDGADHPIRYDSGQGIYGPDMGKALTPADKESMGNAVGAARCARAVDVRVRGLNATDLDPRYPIILAGCLDGRLQDIRLENIHLEFRGGLSLDDAVEQRQITTQWLCKEGDWPTVRQPVQWMAERHNRADEALLPRVRWDQQSGGWLDDPFNVPEDVTQYPEPVQFGILPASALYARHMDDFYLSGLSVDYQVPDSRPTMVLDDVRKGRLKAVDAGRNARLIRVSDAWKRPTGFEYVRNEPYMGTGVEDLVIPPEMDVEDVNLVSPEPGTPFDDLYPYPNRADAASGYTYTTRLTGPSRLPSTVHPPYFQAQQIYRIRPGERLDITVSVRNPGIEADLEEGLVSARHLPAWASFDGHICTWIPTESGRWVLEFMLDWSGMRFFQQVRVEVRKG